MTARLTRILRPLLGSLWFRLVGSAVAVLIFVHGVDLPRALALFGHLSPGWAVLALGLAGISVVASVGEWGILLRGTGYSLDWFFLGLWYLKGLFVNQVLPAGVGSDAMRALQLGRLTGHGPMVASLVASRMAGTLGMAIWALAGAVLLRDLLHVPELTGFAIFAMAMIIAWVLALAAEPVRSRIPENRRLAHAAGRLIGPFTAAFGAYRSCPYMVGTSILVGTLGWGINLLSLQAFSVAIGANVQWTIFAVALPVALLATFVPISANGLGVREGVLVALLYRAGVSLPEATALSLFLDLQLVPFAVLGGVAFLVDHGRLRRLAAVVGWAPTDIGELLDRRAGLTPAPPALRVTPSAPARVLSGAPGVPAPVPDRDGRG